MVVAHVLHRLAQDEIDSKVATLRLQLEQSDQVAPAAEQG